MLSDMTNEKAHKITTTHTEKRDNIEQKIQADAEEVLSKTDHKVIDIIAQVKAMRVQPRVSAADQMVLRGSSYTAATLYITASIAFYVTGSMFVILLGKTYQIRINLIAGFGAALLISSVVFAVYKLISSIRHRKEKDPLSKVNLEARLKYENRCARQLIADQKPNLIELERASLHLKGQVGRYAGYTGARNQYLRSFKDLLLAVFLVFGLLIETATNDWVQPVKLVGAGALILGTVLEQYASAKLYKYQFCLSIIDLTHYLINVEAVEGSAGEK
jgi:hypothetical protein